MGLWPLCALLFSLSIWVWLSGTGSELVIWASLELALKPGQAEHPRKSSCLLACVFPRCSYHLSLPIVVLKRRWNLHLSHFKSTVSWREIHSCFCATVTAIRLQKLRIAELDTCTLDHRILILLPHSPWQLQVYSVALTVLVLCQLVNSM